MTNKLLIFDLDGTLVDTRDLHYAALNSAIRTYDPKCIISYKEHLSTFDGLNTNKKLQMLTELKGLDPKHHKAIWAEKQKITNEMLCDIKPNPELLTFIKNIKQKGWKVAVASNSIRDTIRTCLHSLGVLHEIDYVASNEDVRYTKPFPEMYWLCMTAMNALPSDTIIVEDSPVGRQGAINSGGILFAIEDAYDLNLERLMEKVIEVESENNNKLPWKDGKLNVLIPMAGAGSRFSAAGYTFPKPLIEVHGKPMIQVVVENLNIEANYIFLVQREHYEKYNLKYMLNLIAPNCRIVLVDGLTEGAACTTLLAKDYINNDDRLIIANSDQFIEWNSNEVMHEFTKANIDGGILTFKAAHPKWSYAKVDKDGFVDEVAEKKVISENATVGVYYWSKGSDYVKYAEQMITKNVRVNNEFYVCPVFNQAIEDGKKVRIKDIAGMWGIGTPEDLNYFLEHYKGSV